MANYLYALLCGYLIGCFQTSYLLLRTVKKIDIREKGSGNAGASNASVHFGFKYGVFIAGVDILKGFISVLIMKIVFKNSDINTLNTLMYLSGAACIIGHNFPFYMGFRGGKGTASITGMMFGISPVVGVIGFFVILISSLTINYIAIGAILGTVYLVAITYLLGYGTYPVTISILLLLVSVYKHLENFKRIANGSESTVRGTLNKKRGKTDE